MNTDPDPNTRPSRRLLYLAVALGAVAAFIWLGIHRPWRGDRSALRGIESIIKTELPRRYTDLSIERPTEFCIVGHMRVGRSDMAEFMQKMKFAEKTDYLALRTWGKYKRFFGDSKNLQGFVGVYGAIEGRNGWEFAYDPATEQLWFFVGYSIK
jgi:hypothetical protein